MAAKATGRAAKKLAAAEPLEGQPRSRRRSGAMPDAEEATGHTAAKREPTAENPEGESALCP